MGDIKAQLEQLSKGLEAVLNPPKTQAMTSEEFMRYSLDQVAKATAESGEAQRSRLIALRDAAVVAKTAFEGGAEKVEIPTFAEPTVAQATTAPVQPVAQMTTTAPAATAQPAATAPAPAPTTTPADVNKGAPKPAESAFAWHSGDLNELRREQTAEQAQ
jgi:hypothetical protein